LIASVAGIYSLFPLLFTPAGWSHSFQSVGSQLITSGLSPESLIKLVYSLVWAIMILLPIQRRVYEYVFVFMRASECDGLIAYRFPRSPAFVILDTLERLYIAGFVPLHLVVTILPYVLGPSKEFLPLLLTSVYCAVGLVWAFIRLSVIYLRSQTCHYTLPRLLSRRVVVETGK
jgi:alpha-1,3-glucosyltransferase